MATTASAQCWPRDSVWEREVEGESFHDALQQNLRQFETSVAAGRNVDDGFVDILGRDIALLQTHYQSNPTLPNSHRVSELPNMSSGLQKNASRLQRVHQKAVEGGSRALPSGSGSSEGDPVVLVGSMSAPKPSPQDLDFGSKENIIAWLAKLQSEGFLVRPVYGDGHCLFSSVASQLLTVERLKALLEIVPVILSQDLIPKDPDPMYMINWCLQQLEAGNSVENLLQDAKMYNDWVLFLRRISTGYWGRLINDPRTKVEALARLTPTAKNAMHDLVELPDDQACRQYLFRMSKLKHASTPGRDVTTEYGSDAEIEALSRIFRIRIRVVDANVALNEIAWRDTLKDASPNDIWLLHRNIHYDALYLPTRP